MRLFIASPLNREIENRLGVIIDELRQKGGRVKWVDPKHIHLTMRFLGETEEARVEKITREIDRIAADFSSANTSINQLGGFPNLKRPRVIWVGLDESAEPLAKMARQLELGMRQLRYEKEKPFRAHLTLGRVRDPNALDDLAIYLEKYRFEPIPVVFDRVVLFKSTLTPNGPIYERLHEAKLGEERFG